MLFQQIIYFINLVWSPALEREQSPLYVIDITTIFFTQKFSSISQATLSKF